MKKMELDIEETETPEPEEQDSISYQISYYPADITLKGYLDKWNAGQLHVPPFQRSYVWDQVQASKLLESFLLGLPVPGVFLYKEKKTNRLQIIDGQQRITSAIRFFKNDFNGKEFRLKNVHRRWEGRTYSELEEADRIQLDDAVLRATVVQQLDPNDDSSIFHIFERLNTGGVNLNAMEIRKCVFHGDYFSFLESQNRTPEWRQIIGVPEPDSRLRDLELLLRVLALYRKWESYEKPMKKFLNLHLVSMNRLDPEDLRQAIEDDSKWFRETSSWIFSQLGEKPFHLRGRLNYAVMDSVMVIGGLAREGHATGFRDRFTMLMTDADYLDSVSKSTSDEKVLRKRFDRAISVLLG